jgi:hypothetical protein
MGMAEPKYSFNAQPSDPSRKNKIVTHVGKFAGIEIEPSEIKIADMNTKRACWLLVNPMLIFSLDRLINLLV